MSQDLVAGCPRSIPAEPRTQPFFDVTDLGRRSIGGHHYLFASLAQRVESVKELGLSTLFADYFAIRFLPDVPTTAEQSRCDTLMRERYANPDWNLAGLTLHPLHKEEK